MTSPAPRARPISSRIATLGFWISILSLIALNAWRAWEDRPTDTPRALQQRVNRGNDPAAEQELRRYLRQSPYDGEARMTLARALAARKDFVPCGRELRKVPDWWPAKPEALFLEGQAWKLADHAASAEAAWEALLVNDPLHPIDPRYYSGAARELIAHYVVKGRLDLARDVLWRAYDTAAPHEKSGVLLMRLRAELERVPHEEAVQTLRRYVAADPTDWESRRALALEEQIAGQPAAADREIAATLAARPDDPRAWRTKLEILHLRGDAKGLSEALKHLPKGADKDPEIWKFRGLESLQANHAEAALQAFKKASELQPSEPEYAYLVGTTAARLGQKDDAAREIRRSQRLRDDFQQLHEAFAKYQELASRSSPGPDLDSAATRLAELCTRLGWQREAEAWKKTLAPPA